MPVADEEKLVAEYLWLARAIARDYYLPGADPDDVRQEALVGLLNGIRRYEPGRGMTPKTYYSFSIRRQLATAINAANRQKHRPLSESVRDLVFDRALVPALDTIVDERSDPAAVLDRRLALRAALSEVAGLSARERAALDVHLSEETYESAAARLGCSVKSIDNGIQRVRRKVNARLAA
jgi:RNA polymerase sigma-H factor